MKNLSDIVKNEGPVVYELQDNVVGSLTKEQLEEYFNITNKFLMNETKMVINWMLNNTIMTSKGLADLVNAGMPKDDGTIKEFYKNVKAVIKAGHALEIPLFLTKDQFNSIIERKESLDSIVLDLTTEAGRNAIARQYEPLVWKIARQFNGISELTLEDLFSAGMYGLTYAMNTYGKPRKKKDDEKLTDPEDIEYIKTVKSKTFFEYAGQMIRCWIKEEIKNLGHTIRIPASVQSRDRKEGKPAVKSNAISLDTVIGTDKDGNTKTLMDKIPDYERAARHSDELDEDTLMKLIYDKLDNMGIKQRDLEIFYNTHGLHGYEEEDKKKVGKMHNVGSSSVTHINGEIQKKIRKNPELMELITDLYQHIAECQCEDDAANRGYEPIYNLTSTVNEDEDD